MEKSKPKAGSVCWGFRLLPEPHRAYEPVVRGIPQIRCRTDPLTGGGTGDASARRQGGEAHGDLGRVQEAEVVDRCAVGDVGLDRVGPVIDRRHISRKSAAINRVFVERERRRGVPADRFLAWGRKQARRTRHVDPHLRSCLDRDGVQASVEGVALARLQRLNAESRPDDVVVKIAARLVVDGQGGGAHGPARKPGPT